MIKVATSDRLLGVFFNHKESSQDNVLNLQLNYFSYTLFYLKSTFYTFTFLFIPIPLLFMAVFHRKYFLLTPKGNQFLILDSERG